MTTHFYKALILDDEYFLGDVLAKALAEEGFDSTAVTDVDTAIAALQREDFDIVISDIYLPDKTGQDLFNYALEHHPDLPFIFITGNPNVETAVSFLKKGAYDYLAKPFMLPELIGKVKDVIRKAHKRQAEKALVVDLKEVLRKRSQDLRIYQDIFKSKREGLLIIDLDGLIAQVNPGFEQMSQKDKSDLIDRHISTLEEEFGHLDFAEIQDAIESEGEWKREFSITRKNGEKWIANFSFFPIHDEAGKVFAYSAIINDVTSLRRVENALIGAQEAIIFGLARLAECRDRDTGFHLERLRGYVRELARGMKKFPKFASQITDSYIENLSRSAPLHDIGKVGIPDHILLKGDKLTPEEFEVMKSHTTLGYQTLNSIRRQYGEMEFLNMGIEITYCHHERYDGQGYPRGLRGEEIPLSAQIVAIADMYDALTSQRVYKEAFSHARSVEILVSERGKRFNPDLVEAFLSVAEQFDQIRRQFREKEILFEASENGNGSVLRALHEEPVKLSN